MLFYCARRTARKSPPWVIKATAANLATYQCRHIYGPTMSLKTLGPRSSNSNRVARSLRDPRAPSPRFLRSTAKLPTVPHRAPAPDSRFPIADSPLMSALGQKRTLGNVAPMSALPPIADIKERDRHNGRSPQSLALAFRNNRWRRWGFALAVRCSVGLCGGRDAKESQRRCRQ
jgi:hypothetical protein